MTITLPSEQAELTNIRVVLSTTADPRRLSYTIDSPQDPIAGEFTIGSVDVRDLVRASIPACSTSDTDTAVMGIARHSLTPPEPGSPQVEVLDVVLLCVGYGAHMSN